MSLLLTRLEILSENTELLVVNNQPYTQKFFVDICTEWR